VCPLSQPGSRPDTENASDTVEFRFGGRPSPAEYTRLPPHSPQLSRFKPHDKTALLRTLSPPGNRDTNQPDHFATKQGQNQTRKNSVLVGWICGKDKIGPNCQLWCGCVEILVYKFMICFDVSVGWWTSACWQVRTVGAYVAYIPLLVAETLSYNYVTN